MYSYWTTLTRTHLIHDAWHLGTPSGKCAGGGGIRMISFLSTPNCVIKMNSFNHSKLASRDKKKIHREFRQI